MTEWSQTDQQIIAEVEPTLARTLELRKWWQTVDRSCAYREGFELVRSFNPADTSFGFFDEAPIDGRAVRVMGTVEELAYDEPKQAAPARIRKEFREFVLRYFLRVTHFREPEATFADSPHQVGFGYSQHYYKLRRTGTIGKFDSRHAFAIVDLRELFTRYQWIVLKVSIFDFNITFPPISSGGPVLSLPLAEHSYLVLTRDFVIDRTSAGVRGTYGFGYAFLRDVGTEALLAYGPGHFDVAFESITFQMTSTGETRARLVFVANRPSRLLNLPLDPAGWCSWIAGRGSEWLDQWMLLKHFQQHYTMVTGSLLTWRHIPNWLDTRMLPWSVRMGTSA